MKEKPSADLMEDIIALGKPRHLLLIKAWMVVSLLMLLGLQASRTIISCVDAKQTVSLSPRLIVPQRTGDLILILKLAMDLPYCTSLAE